MDKNKILILTTVFLCVMSFAVELSFMDGNAEGRSSLEQVKKSFLSDIQELKDGKYSNLTAADFSASMEAVEGVYDIQILSSQSYKKRSFLENVSLMLDDDVISLDGQNELDDFLMKSYKDRTFLENFQIMNEVMDKFFGEEMDKSFIQAQFYMDDETIYVDYHDVEKMCADEKYNTAGTGTLFGNSTSEGGYMVQMSESLMHTWFSKGGFGDILPSTNNETASYSYLSCLRQENDAVLHLLDGDIMLSEMEKNVLQYLNTDAFPLPQTEGITYGIKEARVLPNGDYEGVCFLIQRVYDGIPFEDDSGELDYVESESPDTLFGFGKVGGTVAEMQEIKYMFSAEQALQIISKSLEDDSRYEVYGVELVYRNDYIPGEISGRIDDILIPKWKIMTVSKNTNYKITFYVDVVTGEVTERYE